MFKISTMKFFLKKHFKRTRQIIKQAIISFRENKGMHKKWAASQSSVGSGMNYLHPHDNASTDFYSDHNMWCSAGAWGQAHQQLNLHLPGKEVKQKCLKSTRKRNIILFTKQNVIKPNGIQLEEEFNVTALTRRTREDMRQCGRDCCFSF